MGHQGANCPVAWRIRLKLTRGVAEHGTGFQLGNVVRLDGPYVAREHNGGQSGNGTERKSHFFRGTKRGQNLYQLMAYGGRSLAQLPVQLLAPLLENDEPSLLRVPGANDSSNLEVRKQSNMGRIIRHARIVSTRLG